MGRSALGECKSRWSPICPKAAQKPAITTGLVLATQEHCSMQIELRGLTPVQNAVRD